MIDLAARLDRLGLAKYAPIFAAAEVDVDVLRRLSENDLRELGVPLGPRKKILQAAAELSEQQTAKEPRTTDKVEPSSADTAERRQITVLFTECCRFYSSVRPSGCRGPPFACLVARVPEIN
jgi:hypothetical protein